MATLVSLRKLPSHFGAIIGGGALCRGTIHSDILDCDKTFTAYLPQGYDDTGNTARYPVLYLFHPAGGTDETWNELGRLKEIVDDAIRSGMVEPMIVIVPDASGDDEYHLGRHLGYFSVDGWDYESYFHSELIPLIDATFRTIPDRKHRAITGASMGGEAAIAYAQKHPDVYATACSISGILGRPESSKMAATDKAYADSLIANNPTAFVNNASDDVVEALRSVRWYADCGDSDFFYQGNIDFFLAMKARGIPMAYRMRSGVHSWFYWISGLQPILSFITAGF